MAKDELNNRFFCPRKILVTTDNPGRLGNLITRHGHLLAYCLENGYWLIDYSFLELGAWFPNLRRNLLYGYPVIPVGRMPKFLVKAGFRLARITHRVLGRKKLPLTSEWLYCRHAPYPEVTDLSAAEFIESTRAAWALLLGGYIYRANELFKKHADDIRAQFKVAPEIQEEVGRFLSQLREPEVSVIGVHVRHGDYRDYCEGSFFFTTEQHGKVLQSLQECQPLRRFRFVVCSDEPQCAESFGPVPVTVHAGSCLSDLHLLSCCDAVISTDSSFARCAAFLGGIPLYQMTDPSLPASPDRFVKIDILHAVDW